MKLLVLIIASDNLPVYQTLQQLWNYSTHPDVDYWFLKGNEHLQNEYEADETTHTFTVKCRDDYHKGIVDKTLKALQVLSTTKAYDYILRTNLSSFYIFDRLMELLKTAPRTNYYAGIEGKHNGKPFVSGCGFIMSPDIVKTICEHPDKVWDASIGCDDVCFGQFIHQHHLKGLPYTHIRRYDIYQPQSDFQAVVHELKTDRSICHIRIKHDYYREVYDVQVRALLTELFYAPNCKW